MSEEKGDATARARALFDRAKKDIEKIEASDIAIVGALGQTMFSLIQSGGWPTKTQVLEFLASVETGAVRLPNTTTGMAKSARDFISQSPD